MPKTIEEETALTALEESVRQLAARPEGQMLTPEEFMELVRRMPKMPAGWTSADDIRELRGPLPDEDESPSS